MGDVREQLEGLLIYPREDLDKMPMEIIRSELDKMRKGRI